VIFDKQTVSISDQLVMIFPIINEAALARFEADGPEHAMLFRLSQTPLCPAKRR
jgi:hypothetical protein